MKRYFLIILISLVVYTGFSQSNLVKKYAATITLEELTEHLNVLASDEFEGRDTGAKGQKLAAEYIKKQFVNNGLIGPSPSEDPYFQEFNLYKTGLLEFYLETKDIKLEAGKDFYNSAGKFSGELDAEVIFIGYGIDHEIYSDYKDIDVKGKIVAYFSGEPKNKNGKYLITGTVSPSENSMKIRQVKKDTAYSRGAIGTIRILTNEK